MFLYPVLVDVDFCIHKKKVYEGGFGINIGK